MIFLVLGSTPPWVKALNEALTSLGHEVVGIEFLTPAKALADYRQNRSVLKRRVIVPPMYGTRLSVATRPYISAFLNKIFRENETRAPNQTWVIVTHPITERWLRKIPNERLIYWNYDDYALYSPNRADEVRDWEKCAIERAAIVLCASRYQTDKLRSSHKEYSSKIRHFPNAVRSSEIRVDRPTLIKNSVGFVGSIGERIDWRLVHEVIERNPKRRFVFVGPLDQTKKCSSDWSKIQRKVWLMPNVQSIGWVDPEVLWRYYSSFEVGWMPYDILSDFNRASCPTKIFDSLASGRPFISTAIPECKLYQDHIKIVSNEDEATQSFEHLAKVWGIESCNAQIDFASENTWDQRATALITTLEYLR